MSNYNSTNDYNNDPNVNLNSNRGRPSKNPTELAPSTFRRQRETRQLPWTTLYDAEALQVTRSGIRDRAVRTWLALRPVLNNNEKRGYLLTDIKTLALTIGERSPKKLAEDIDQLIAIGVLARGENDEIYSKWMISHENSRLTQTNLSGNHDDSILNEKSQPLPSEEVPQGEGIMRPDELCRRVEYSREEKMNVSESSLLSSSVTDSSDTTTAPASATKVASAAHWIGKIDPSDFAHIANLEAAIGKWLRLSAENGWTLSTQKLCKFLKREKPQSSPNGATRTPKKQPSAKAEAAATIAAQHAAVLRTMPPMFHEDAGRRLGQCVEWVRDHITECDADADLAREVINCAIKGKLFVEYLVDECEGTGYLYENEGKLGWIGANQIAEDRRGNPRCQNSKWLVAAGGAN
jgi:hypothetical protein